jgi:hypothetical protein
MTTQLPAHLANLPNRNLAARATQGMGSQIPPHISIQGNRFTLIDAANNEQDAGPVIEAVIIDISDVMCKRYMDPDKPWTPDSNDPPLCWSSNGIGPSIEAATPQAETCIKCPNNVRGSATSKLSGASIKACRDEKYLALMLPKYPDMIFRLVLTPGSFKNWDGFTALFKGRNFDMDKVLTQFSFVPKVNGVLAFKPTTFPGGSNAFIDAATANTILAALNEKKTDALVGRLDRPRDGLLAPSPTQGQLATAPNAVSKSSPAMPQAVEHFNSPGLSGTTTVAASVEAPAAPAKPRGRPRKAAQEAPAPEGQPFGAEPTATAPFMPSAPPATGNSGFGIQQGVAPNPELQNAIDNMFGPQS